MNFFSQKPLNAVTFFLALWCVIIFFSCLNLYEIDRPSDQTFVLLLLMIIFFTFGGIMGHLIRFRYVSVCFIKHKKEVNYTLFIILFSIMFLFGLRGCFSTIKYVLEGVPLWQIRNWKLSAYESDNTMINRSFILQLISVLIVIPFQTIFYPFVAYYFLNSECKTRKRILFVISLFCLAMDSIAGAGGRLGTVCYVLYFFLAYSFSKKGKIMSYFMKRKIRKIILRLAGLGVICVVCLSSLRNGVGKFFKETYTYFALSPTLLDKWLPELYEGTKTCGLLTFFGLHSYFFRTLIYLGLDDFVPEIYETSYQWILNAEKWKVIGAGSANAFVTPVFYFYKDGGWVAVAFLSLLFGFIVEKLDLRFRKNNNVGSFVLYCLLMYGVLVSFMRIQTCIPSYWISYVWTFVLFDYKNNEKKEE